MCDINREEGNEMLRNIDEYEYPRTNDTLRQMHRQRWLDYYECLKGAYADAGRERIAYPSALVALEGTSVTYGDRERERQRKRESYKTLVAILRNIN